MVIKNWVFYGINKDTTVLHAIKKCAAPERTNEYAEIRQYLDNYIYERVGYMTAKAWNSSNQYVKIDNT